MANLTYKNEDAVIKAALSIMERRAKHSDDKDLLFNSPNVAKEYLRLRLADLEHEVFCVCFLDNQHRLLACEDMFRGTIDGAAVYPREVLKAALTHNAVALVLGHNHPSGTVTPSTADRRITDRLVSAVGLCDLRVLDHIIVGHTGSLSFAEEGYL